MDITRGFLNSQRSLAEITETIRTAHLVHQGIFNLQNAEKDGKENSKIEYVNKMKLLLGDHLLSMSLYQLAALRLDLHIFKLNN